MCQARDPNQLRGGGIMVFVECGGYTFNDGFDSGNLGRVELVKRYTDGKWLALCSIPLAHIVRSPIR